MKDYKYLIVGAGMTADSAVSGLREVDEHGSIGIVGAEPHPPYNRPPLTKGLWKGKQLESIWRNTAKQKVELHLGRKIERLDLPGRNATDDLGNSYSFSKLLLATGGTPRHLPFDEGQVIYFRTLDDYQRLRSLSGKADRIVVIGGGFIGSEIAAALAMTGKKVTMTFPEEGIGGRAFPKDLAHFLNQFYREKGVDVLAGESVAGIHEVEGRVVLRVENGKNIAADGVVAGIGIQPNVDLARQAGIEIANGVVVDELLRTSRPDVYAAGDVAAFYNPALGKRIRVEHEDNANTMGKAAGRNMAGKEEPYVHLPYFYSDLFELGYEGLGELDARLETVADWTEPYRKGVVYYLHDRRVRGVLLWNVWEQVEAARNLIGEPGPFKAEDLKGHIKG